MSELELLQREIRKSNLIEIPTLLIELDNGAIFELREKATKAKSCGLLQTYKIRLNHNKNKNGSHAKRLSLSTKEFVENLGAEDPELIRTASVRTKPYGSYLIWFLPNSYKIIGCMFVVSVNEVSQSKWLEMWGKDET